MEQDNFIRRLDSPSPDEILAAYHPGLRCFAFNGEMRLLEQFLGFIHELFSAGRVEMALLRPRTVAMPLDGVNAGFLYDEFAAKLKTGDCVLFISDGIGERDKGEKEKGEEAGESRHSVSGAVASVSLLPDGPNGLDILASTASIAGDEGKTNDENEASHQRYSFRQRRRRSNASGTRAPTNWPTSTRDNHGGR